MLDDFIKQWSKEKQDRIMMVCYIVIQAFVFSLMVYNFILEELYFIMSFFLSIMVIPVSISCIIFSIRALKAKETCLLAALAIIISVLIGFPLSSLIMARSLATNIEIMDSTPRRAR
jgi:hypothetical protein